jgi:hypothetical protein
MTRTLDLDKLILGKGAHQRPDDGFCLLEAAAYLAGEDHSDHPQCVSEVLGAFGRDLNDRLDDAKRQQLKPLIPRLLGTAGDGLDERRGYLALDWLIRAYTPAWLDLAGLTAEAAEVRALRRIVDLAAAKAAGPVVRASADKARAAWAAAWAAAGDAAGDAAWAAARDAARAAAWDAAWAAAGDAAWDAAWAAAWAAAGDAAGDAARAAARDAARAAAWDAAWAAARDAAWAAAGAAARDAARDAAWAAAWAAARDAAGDALKPTVDQLQDSAIALFTTMIRPDGAR